MSKMNLRIIAAVSLLSCTQWASASMIAGWEANGNAEDFLGNHPGTLLGGTTFSQGVYATQSPNESFQFNNNGNINVPHAQDFNFGTGDFSVTFWVNFSDLGIATNGIISKDSFPDGGLAGWLFNINNSGVGIEVRNVPEGMGVVHARWGTTNFVTDQWFHIAGVRESNVVKLYVDGELRASVNEPQPIDVNTDSDIIIGAVNNPPWQHLNGQVDDIGIFNTALSKPNIDVLIEKGIRHIPEPSTLIILGLGTATLLRRRGIPR